MADHLDVATVDVELARLLRRFGDDLALACVGFRGVYGVVGRRLFDAGWRFNHRLDGFAGIIDGHFLDARGIAIEIRIGKVPRGGASEVDDVEVFLAVVDLQTRAAPDDLFELGAGADHARQHHVLDHLGVDAGGQQLRGGQDHRRGFVYVLKVREMGQADRAFVGRDAADVVGVLLDQIAVEIDQFLAHLGCVLLIDAEHDGLGEAVGALEEIGEVLRNRLGARTQRDDALEILGLVLVVRHRAAEAVEFVLGRPPAGGIHRGDDAMHAIRREKAILDALAQAIGVDRVAEVFVAVA